MVLTITIKGNGKAQNVRLFDAINWDKSLPEIEVLIDNDGENISYEAFMQTLSVTRNIFKYVKYSSDGASNVSVWHRDAFGAELRYLISSFVPFDYSFFIVAEFPHHGRRSETVLTFQLF